MLISNFFIRSLLLDYTRVALHLSHFMLILICLIPDLVRFYLRSAESQQQLPHLVR